MTAPSPATLAVHAGNEPDPATGARQLRLLEEQLRQSRPEGGSLVREVARLASACGMTVARGGG